MSILPWLIAGWLFAIGVYGIVTSRHYVHIVGCLTVCQSGTYVLLLGIGYKWHAGAPIFYDHPPGTPAAGASVPQSMSMRQLPSNVTAEIPAAKGLAYAKLSNNEILLINPKDRRVADVISPSGTTGAAPYQGPRTQGAPR